MKKKIFIDGEEGTTGLQIFKKLSNHPNVELLKIDRNKRKSHAERKRLMELSDATFLCLPDKASIEALELWKEISSNCPVLIDASSAHRTLNSWVYGLPELSETQRYLISRAQKISVPGCYATGANLLIKPLIKNSIIPKDYAFIINAVSGYSGGGKKLINYFESSNHESFFYYGLDLDHKHIKEIKFHNQLDQTPIFIPSVANFFQGMIVNLPLHGSSLNKDYSIKDIKKIFQEEYKHCHFVKTEFLSDSFSVNGYYRPDKLINTNNFHIHFFENEKNNQIVLSSIFDNLGKGASGAAIQCMNLVFGFQEQLGLE